MKDITYEESLQLSDPVYIDVRSPFEFGSDHIPGAINIPLFNNEERIEVGTLYRMTGKDFAVSRGMEIVGGKLRAMIDEIMAYKNKNIAIYCARGGMRSSSVASLLSSLGMEVYRIIQGYKGYRRYINDRLPSLTPAPPLFVLQGLTGSGKTGILSIMDNVIDLEAMAGHRSSIFGGIGLNQSTQKYFETLLLHRINELRNADYIIIEGESQKIGNLHIPDSLFQVMRSSRTILIETPIERRIDIITGEYAKYSNSTIINDIVLTLTSKIGKKNVDILMSLYKEGNVREFTRILLEKYYDPRYSHSLERMEFVATIINEDTEKTAAGIKTAIGKILNIDFT